MAQRSDGTLFHAVHAPPISSTSRQPQHDPALQGPAQLAGPTSLHPVSSAAEPAPELPPALFKTIEGEVIPRLLMALKGNGGQPAVARAPTRDQIDDLAELAVSADDRGCAAFIELLRSQGMRLETIYLDLLAPTARRLNDMWAADICDFSDVTVGLGRLHNVVRKLSPAFRLSNAHVQDRGQDNDRIDRRRALIAPVPGNQHTFGCVIIEDFFTRAGWEVCGWPVSCDYDLAELVACDHYDLVGLSVGCDLDFGAVPRLLKRLRRESRNRSMVIAVGGGVFADDPQCAGKLGADFATSNATDAVTIANDTVARLAQQA